MMRKFFLTSLFAATALFLMGQPSENLKEAKWQRVSKTYGFLLGQEYSLNRIKKELPELKNDLLVAEMSFDLTFSKAREGVENYLKEYAGSDEEFKKVDQELRKELAKILGDQIYNFETATVFIEDVKSRAKGNIPSPFLETLLSFQYADNPAKEFISGFTTTFQTKGHPKAKNTDWQAKIPQSWLAEEGDRPNVIKRFKSDYGAGNQIMALMVKEIPLPKGYRYSKQELNELFTESEMKDLIPDGAKFISFSKITIDGMPAGILEFEQTSERIETKVKLRLAEFIFIDGNKMFFFQAGVGTTDLSEDLSIQMKKFLPLYKLVANSIVLNSRYN